jgi:hypothetical protein
VNEQTTAQTANKVSVFFMGILSKQGEKQLSSKSQTDIMTFFQAKCKFPEIFMDHGVGRTQFRRSRRDHPALLFCRIKTV